MNKLKGEQNKKKKKKKTTITREDGNVLDLEF
jgi:hypothetical protein